MFPEDIQNYLDNEQLIYEPQKYQFNGTSYLYDFKKGDFVLRNGKLVELTGKAAIAMWLEKIIRTEKFRFKVYENVDYCVTIERLIGGIYPRGFVEAEIKREITEASLYNSYILDIVDWSFERDKDYLKIAFTVIVADHVEEGNFLLEVVLNGGNG